MDNEFRSNTLNRFAEEWNLELEYRAAQGNGILERIHLTIKRTVAQSNCSINMAMHNETISSANSERPG